MKEDGEDSPNEEMQSLLNNRALPKTARRVDIQFIEYIIPTYLPTEGGYSIYWIHNAYLQSIEQKYLPT